MQGPSNVVEVMREKRSMHAKTIQVSVLRTPAPS